MSQTKCFNHGQQDPLAAPSHTDKMPTLFACAGLTNGVSVTAVNANKIESLALADLWCASNAVGVFEQFVTSESSKLRVLHKSVEAVKDALVSVTVETLQPYVDAIERSRCEAQAAAQADEELKSMGLEEFGRLVYLRSDGKIIPVTCAKRNRVSRHGTVTFQFKSVALLPVTHFKALARLVTYQSSDKTFAYSETCGADLRMRVKLLSVAEKIARSTKKVTQEEIAARRARRLARSDMLSQDEIERYIIDCIGWGEDKPEHIAEAVKALTRR